MRNFVILLIVFLTLKSEDSFLTDSEYAAMLYKNPRGIGCHVCHGVRGEGGYVARTIYAPPINKLSMNRFKIAFKKKMRYMPRYYLTNRELAYIYFYLVKQRGTSSEYAK
jgi:hypothetical protein